MKKFFIVFVLVQKIKIKKSIHTAYRYIGTWMLFVAIEFTQN